MLAKFIEIAFSAAISTSYGYSEWNCGDVHAPRRCEHGAITASGEVFNPDLPTAAVFAPAKLRLKTPAIVLMQIDDGPCAYIRINDKGHERFIGKRGFDLTPASLELLTGTRNPKWVGKISKCKLGESNEASFDRIGIDYSDNRSQQDMSRSRQTVGSRPSSFGVHTSRNGSITGWRHGDYCILERQRRSYGLVFRARRERV